jgi:hypothetical protein
LPEASFCAVGRTDWALGLWGRQSETFGYFVPRRHLDFIVECVDDNFGFSRYAERLGRSANSLTNCKACNKKQPYIDDVLLSILKERIETIQPTVFLISIPFPGNLYSAFDRRNG